MDREPDRRHSTSRCDAERHSRDRGDHERILLYNPASGSADHAVAIRRRARERGYVVRETTGPGDAREIARQAAADGTSVLAVAGGDGTVNEAIGGLSDAEALGTVDLAVVPTGTANLFARSLGVDDIETAFDALDRGIRRRIDVGFADGTPFVNTCLAGVPAEANTATSDELKRRLGAFAYVLTMVRYLPEYDGVPLEVTMTVDDTNDDGSVRKWRGTALLVLIGNAFRLPGLRRRDQPNAENGLLEVTILEDRQSLEFDDGSVLSAVLEGEFGPVTRLETAAVTVSTRTNEPVSFSLDGEPFPASELEVGIRKRCLSVYAVSSNRGLL